MHYGGQNKQNLSGIWGVVDLPCFCADDCSLKSCNLTLTDLVRVSYLPAFLNGIVYGFWDVCRLLDYN